MTFYPNGDPSFDGLCCPICGWLIDGEQPVYGELDGEYDADGGTRNLSTARCQCCHEAVVRAEDRAARLAEHRSYLEAMKLAQHNGAPVDVVEALRFRAGQAWRGLITREAVTR